tara:strand:- start:228 stop:536 length:309 start_codon:yes stop_codon:yes gene_type:complete
LWAWDFEAVAAFKGAEDAEEDVSNVCVCDLEDIAAGAGAGAGADTADAFVTGFGVCDGIFFALSCGVFGGMLFDEAGDGGPGAFEAFDGCGVGGGARCACWA